MSFYFAHNNRNVRYQKFTQLPLNNLKDQTRQLGKMLQNGLKKGHCHSSLHHGKQFQTIFQ